jgi:integrase
LRHSGASVMDNNNVPIGDIQRILGHERGNSHTESHTARSSQSKRGLSP